MSDQIAIEYDERGIPFVYALNFRHQYNTPPGIYTTLSGAQSHVARVDPDMQWRDMRGFEGVAWVTIDDKWVIDKCQVIQR